MAVVLSVSATIVVAGVIMAQHVLSAPRGAFAAADAETVSVGEPALTPAFVAVAGILWVLFALFRRRHD